MPVSTTFDCSDSIQRERGIGAAIAAIRRNELVVLPTDTVYGLAADAFMPSAVDALLSAKGRGRDMPVPVLVASRDMAEALFATLSVAGRALADAFWPGPLTLVTTHNPALAWDLGDTRGTVALRMPDHPLALALISETGPLAVSSANRSGDAPATTVLDAQAQLGEDVSVYLDGGPCGVAVPSTIVDLTGDVPRILRLGALDADALRAVVPVE
ncbi:MAG: L-threonylcarbamoyladenylate synthase [Frankiales bacterium]|jgi:tRNA threonylcarbamoyl adenosine modification protein (Sua5/YciO/YrdC/YwlC family)|nr:L-threonylcarbamoyladenylate synthase [Frankiales bacterium]